MQVRKWLAAAVVVGLFATACGGDDDASGDTTGDTTTDSGATDDSMDDRSDWPDKVVLGLVPSREADKLIESAQPLADALTEALGIEVEAFVPQDYTALTEAMASGQADIGAFGALGLIRAIDQANAEFVLQSSRFGSFTYHTQYFTNDPDTYCDDEPQADEDGFLYCNGTLDAGEGPVAAESLTKIEAGTSFAYVEQTSTSGFLFPTLQMIEQGVDVDAVDTFFAGGHDAAVIAVYNGDAEVGVSFDDARGGVQEQFEDVGEQVVVFAYSEEIPNDGFVVRGELPASFKQAFVDAMLTYAETPEGEETLNSIYEITGLREADPSVLDVVRRADEELGDQFEEG